MYYKHAKFDDIYLVLQILDPGTGSGVTGATPRVAIRRVRESQGGAALDGWYWDGAAFTVTPTWHTLAPLDAVNTPGLYSYLFRQTLVGENIIYAVYFQNQTDPVGFAVEEHVVTDELRLQTDVGARQVTLYLDDQFGDPVLGAQVDLYDAANLAFITRYHTGVDGSVTFAVDDGSYNLRLFRTGYAFTTPEPLVVSADATVTYEGIRVFIPTAPSDPDLCVIYGTIRDVAGNPLPGTCVGAYARTPQDVQGSQLGEQVAHAETDAAGYFELELLRGAEVILAVESTGLSISRIVPALASQDLTTWDV